VKHESLVKLIYNVVFFIIQLCLLFVVFQKGICDGKMLVLFHVFIGLCFMGWICSLMGVHWLLNAIYGVKITKTWWEGFKWKWIVGWGNGFGGVKLFFFQTFRGNWFSFFMYDVDNNSLCLGLEFF
jgi:hypothetical protein